ncbi:hypothetical protein BKA83DRAFT_235784 [Pisolithus microcarpus]|nr:hypothetical protein BKA83DRAFT_235784 [Pisolithus microcarpus]
MGGVVSTWSVFISFLVLLAPLFMNCRFVLSPHLLRGETFFRQMKNTRVTSTSWSARSSFSMSQRHLLPFRAFQLAPGPYPGGYTYSLHTSPCWDWPSNGSTSSLTVTLMLEQAGPHHALFSSPSLMYR